MAKQSNLLWVSEITQEYPNWLHALTFPIKHPTTAALVSDLNEFNFKEPQMSDAPAESATPVQDAASQAIDTLRFVVAENTTLRERLANQRATIQEYQRHDAGGTKSSLKAQLERALHTQKILERDLEEYQQAYAALKASVFSDDDRTLPPRLLAFGHGAFLAYPAKVCASDDDTAPKWGLVIDSETDKTPVELSSVLGKNVVLTDGDVAITFEKPSDVLRLIDTLQEVAWRMYVDLFESASKTE